MSAIANIKAMLAAAVAPAGTVTVPYPTGTTQASLTGTTGGSLALNNNDRFPQAASGAGTVAFAFGASNITVTNNSGITWPANSEIIVSFGQRDINGNYNLTEPRKIQDKVNALP